MRLFARLAMSLVLVLGLMLPSSLVTTQMLVASASGSSIVVGSGPTGVAVNSSTNRVYVANAGSGTLSVIDGASRTQLGTVRVGLGPAGVAVNELSNRIFV